MWRLGVILSITCGDTLNMRYTSSRLSSFGVAVSDVVVAAVVLELGLVSVIVLSFSVVVVRVRVAVVVLAVGGGDGELLAFDVYRAWKAVDIDGMIGTTCTCRRVVTSEQSNPTRLNMMTTVHDDDDRTMLDVCVGC
jgi:hypothetical protein